MSNNDIASFSREPRGSDPGQRRKLSRSNERDSHILTQNYRVNAHRLAISQYRERRDRLLRQAYEIRDARYRLDESLDKYSREVAKGNCLRNEVSEIVDQLEKVQMRGDLMIILSLIKLKAAVFEG